MLLVANVIGSLSIHENKSKQNVTEIQPLKISSQKYMAKR